MPMQVLCEVDGMPMTLRGSLDYGLQEIIMDETPKGISEDDLKNNIMSFLNSRNNVEENQFQAKEEVYEQAKQAELAKDGLIKNNMGDE